MAIFGPKAWINPFKKISIFRLFELLVFIAQKGVVSFQNIVKDIFLPYISLTKNVEEMAIFGPKPWVNPFEKISFFLFFKILVYSLEKRSFLLEYSKKHFPGLYCPKKKRKMAILGPFGTISIFRLFELLVFIAQKDVLSFQNKVKGIFLADTA